MGRHAWEANSLCGLLGRLACGAIEGWGMTRKRKGYVAAPAYVGSLAEAKNFEEDGHMFQMAWELGH
eukprot:1161941-Pelagomonas_calceolata.AAC.7